LRSANAGTAGVSGVLIFSAGSSVAATADLDGLSASRLSGRNAVAITVGNGTAGERWQKCDVL
jgi:hypothetical protein